MPISTAYNKCPKAVFLRPDMEKYAMASHQIFSILERFTPDIEPISIDEAFMDITGSYTLFGTPLGTCRKIKAAIKKETDLTASIGLAPNKMTAKIASDMEKPDGLVEVNPVDLLSFLHPLPAGKLWGVGEKTLEAFKRIGIFTIGDLAQRGEEELERLFGVNGQHVWELSNGIDDRSVETVGTIKSISNEHTFEKDVTDTKTILDVLMHLSEKVSMRLRRSDFKGRTITLKIRFSDFKTYTRGISLDMNTNFVDDIYENVLKKLQQFNTDKRPVRLLGVKVSNLSDTSWQENLFEGTNDKSLKKERLHKALDSIVDRFGAGAVKRRRI
jgi:DNA polymerase-4